MRTFIFLFCTAVFSLSPINILSQNAKIKIDKDKTVTVDQVFDLIKSQTDYTFIYRSDMFKGFPNVHLKKGIIKANKLLQRSLSNNDFKFEMTTKNTIVIRQKPNFRINLKKTQQRQITGTITDENGNPLPGATIRIKRKENNSSGKINDGKIRFRINGTSSDIDGKYNLVVPNDALALIITYVGYKTIEIQIDGKIVIDVQLQPSNAELDEVVLVGYGQVKREAVTGSVSSVPINSITNQAPTINLDNALQGLVPGVYVSSATGQPGAAARIRIRGTTSLLGSNQPLFVIDGIPVVVESNIPTGGTQGGSLSNQLAQQGLSTPIGNINSADIESISILKDASAAAIYGSRAANGVIIINTKQGVYEGKPTFDVSLTTTTQTPRTLDVLNASQFREMWTTAVNNSTSTDSYSNSVRDGSYFGTADTNWEDEVSPGSPVSTSFNIGVYGGSKKTRYSTSLSINTNDGVYKNSGFDRYTYNLNIDTNVSDVWKFGSKMNISFSEQEFLDRGLTQLIYDFRPDVPVLDDEGNFSFSPQLSQENPVARSQATNTNKTLLLLGSFYTQLRLAKGLNIKSMLSINYNNGNQLSFYPKFTSRGGWDRRFGEGDGFAQESRSRITNTVWDNTLSYNGYLGEDHFINAVMGISFERKKNSNVRSWGEGFFNNVLTNVNSATVFTDGSSFEEGSGLESYFGRVNYDYKNKYLITLSGRVDGSSKFAKDNQYAFFPAAAVAWRISNEPFLEDNKIINELKLRMSLGRTGQQDFGSYAWRTLYQTEDYGSEPSIILQQLGNDNLKWETTDQFDVGTDFSLFNNRLSGTLAYYSKKTTDALFTTKLPGSAGFPVVIANIGNTKNTGVEFELKGTIVQNENFNWILGFNISKNSNVLTKINDDFKNDQGFATGFPGGGFLREGDPIGLLYGYVADGLFQNQTEIDALNTASPTGIYQRSGTSPGDIRFVDISGPDGVPDGRITNLDQQTIGDTQPDFFGGINSTFTYRGFSLSTVFTFSSGNDLYAFGRARATNFFSTFFGENKDVDVLNSWTPQNTDTDIPRAVYRDPNNNGRISSHYAYDASFLRLKTLNLSYTFSKSFLEKIKFLDRASIFMTGQNLLTFTNYPGADPEASNLYNNDISSGRDNNRFPVAKVFTAGLRVGF